MEPKRINEIFHCLNLEGNYTLLEDDLIKLAQAYAEEGARQERTGCVGVVASVNRVVGEKLAEVRGK